VYEADGADYKKGDIIPGDWYVVVDLAGFADVQKAQGYRQKRLDMTAIAVVKVLDDERWWVRDLYLGRWGVEETSKRIVDAVESCKTLNLGIEKGALLSGGRSVPRSRSGEARHPAQRRAAVAREPFEGRSSWLGAAGAHGAREDSLPPWRPHEGN
jgi:hypothetical protein